MSLQKLMASSTAICGARARDLSQAPRQSGAPAPGQAGQARARKFLELSQGQWSFLSPRGALAEPRGGLAEADAVTCTVHWRIVIKI